MEFANAARYKIKENTGGKIKMEGCYSEPLKRIPEQPTRNVESGFKGTGKDNGGKSCHITEEQCRTGS